jgi:hypothetical protein
MEDIEEIVKKYWFYGVYPQYFMSIKLLDQGNIIYLIKE